MLPNLDALYGGAGLFHHAGELMPQDDRGITIGRALRARENMRVRSTHAACFYADENFVFLYVRRWKIFFHTNVAFSIKNRRFHGYTSLGLW